MSINALSYLFSPCIDRKLQSARERLARLQSLVSMVQQWPESAEVLPEDLAELAASAMDDDTASECSNISKVRLPTSVVAAGTVLSVIYLKSLLLDCMVRMCITFLPSYKIYINSLISSV